MHTFVSKFKFRVCYAFYYQLLPQKLRLGCHINPNTVLSCFNLREGKLAAIFLVLMVVHCGGGTLPLVIMMILHSLKKVDSHVFYRLTRSILHDKENSKFLVAFF